MATHRRTVTVVNFELLLQWEHPIARGLFESLPAGPTVHATRAGRRVVNAPIAANGRVTLPVPVLSGGSERYGLEIDFAGFEYLDIANKAFVAEAARAPNDTRALIRMPAVWRSRAQASFSDDLGGRFARGELRDPQPDQQGTAAAPWALRIDHAWERVYLEWTYYDSTAKAAACAPYGLLVEAFSAARMRDAERVAAGSVIHDDGLVCLAIHTRTAPSRLHVRLTTAAGTYLNLREPRPKHRMTTRTDAAYEALPGTGKRALYPMPALWVARGQRGRHGGTSADFAGLITRTTTAGNRITFDLDDTVLVSPTGQPIPVPTGSASRLALIDHVMAIRNPDAANPYLSTDTITGNYVPGPLLSVAGQDHRRVVRVIRFGANFYDVGTRRTTRGSRIGARAAQRDDHPRERVRAPLSAGIGNFDLHYFHDCAVDSAGEPLSHLLIYWSGRFRAGPSTGPLTPAQVQAFEPALLDARIRHEGWHPSDPSRSLGTHKHYYMKPEPSAASPKRTIKPVFHFAAFRNDQAICRVAVRNLGANSRDWMAQTEAEFGPNSSAPDTSTTYTDVDGISYPWYTLAHEIGHALGLIDEYPEPIDNPSLGGASWNRPVMPQFQQWWGPRHFSWDEGSLMNSNQAPRLRHFWQYARWINGHAGVQALLGNVEYKLQYKRGAKTFEFYLPRTRSNYLTAIHSATGFAHNHGRMDVFLYDTGKDELSALPGHLGIAGADGFDAILEVRILVNVRFTGAGWTPALRQAELVDLETAANRQRGGGGAPSFRHTLEDAGAPLFKKVLVYFELRYDVGAGTGRHFRFNMHQASAAGAPASDLASPATTGATLTTRDTDSAGSLLRYMLGLTFVNVVPPPPTAPAGTPPTTTPITNIAAGHLSFLATWLKAQRDTAPDNTSGYVHTYTHRRYT